MQFKGYPLQWNDDANPPHIIILFSSILLPAMGCQMS